VFEGFVQFGAELGPVGFRGCFSHEFIRVTFFPFMAPCFGFLNIARHITRRCVNPAAELNFFRKLSGFF
jgi:hypothetical protein